jgi:hypothetical protein
MEMVRIEVKRLIILVRLKHRNGVTKKEWDSILRGISDEAVLKLFKRSKKDLLYAEEKIVEAILVQRMRKWQINKLIKALTGITFMDAYETIVAIFMEKMIKGDCKTIEKLSRLANTSKNDKVLRAFKDAGQKIKESDKLRPKLGLEPFIFD